MEKWNVVKTHQVIKDRWIDVRAEDCVTGRGVEVKPFYTYHPKDWVLVAAVTPLGEWLIVEQYRHGLRDFDFEFPAGNCEKGDSPLATAQKELAEETGYGEGTWRCVGKWPFNPSNHSNFVHAFLAENVKKISDLNWDEAEEMRIHLWSGSQVFAAVEKGQIQNGLHQLLCYKFKELFEKRY